MTLFSGVFPVFAGVNFKFKNHFIAALSNDLLFDDFKTLTLITFPNLPMVASMVTEPSIPLSKAFCGYCGGKYCPISLALCFTKAFFDALAPCLAPGCKFCGSCRHYDYRLCYCS